jgi:ApaG protein
MSNSMNEPAMPDSDIVVRAVSVYRPEESDLSNPAERKYVFAYRIQIENRGALAVRLLSRHWWITDAVQEIREVEGEGVVGQQPVIAPGQMFTYSSWCVLPTPTGLMRGTYAMLTAGGERIEVPIPTFSLAVPTALN